MSEIQTGITEKADLDEILLEFLSCPTSQKQEAGETFPTEKNNFKKKLKKKLDLKSG